MLFGNLFNKSGKGGGNKGKKQKPLRLRSLRIEILENRELLSITAGEFDALRDQYADLELSANMTDYNVIVIKADQLSEDSLRAAIAEAGTTEADDLIVVRTTESRHTITLDGTQLTVNVNAANWGSVTIVSLGTDQLTIDAAEKSRVMTISGSGSDVALAGLTITNGRFSGNSGGGIYQTGGKLAITQCTITGNRANSGGGIYAKNDTSATVTIVSNSIISDNNATSTSGGAGIYVSTFAVLEVTNSEISKNISRYGGAGICANSGSTVTVSGSTISGNTGGSTSSGGGIYASGSVNLTVTDNSTISGNATGNGGIGGGIYVTSNSTLTVTNNISITGNTATRGGGIAAGTGSTVTVSDSKVSGNFGSHGGAGFYLDHSNLIVSNSEISGNTITYSGHGGGIYISDGAAVVTDSKIFDNTALDNGGGIYAGLRATVTVTDSKIFDNTAENGGGIRTSSSVTLDVTSSEISGNTAKLRGGGLYLNSTTVTITDSTVSGNKALKYQGGGFFLSDTDLVITNSTISENTAASSGGGFDTGYDSTLTVTNCAVSNNTASGGDGGGINAPYLTATNSVIVGNTASRYGGGIKCSSAVTITNCTIASNTATTRAGGIYADANTFWLYNSIVVENAVGNSNSNIYNYRTVNGNNNLTDFTGWGSSSDPGSNLLYDSALPLFVNAANGDYRLASGSPAIDAGNNQYAYNAGLDGNSLDVAGNPRFIGDAIDLGALENSEHGDPATHNLFGYRIVAPSVLGNAALGELYVEVTNHGNADGEPMLLLLDAARNGKSGALLTLDDYRIANGYNIDTYPEDFRTSLSLLATGSGEHGKIAAGETVRIPVYYIGWEKPWDSLDPYDFTLAAIESSNNEVMDLASLKTTLKPEEMSDDAWNTVWANFISLTGTTAPTWGDYVTMLTGFAAYLDGLGQKTYDAEDLIQIALGWADDVYNPMGAPIVSTDSAASGTGFLIAFTRSYYGTAFSSRDKIDSMGYGWDNNWNWKLELQDDGDLTLLGPHGIRRTFQVDARITHAGMYVGAYNDTGLMKKVGNEYVLTEQSGSVLTFHATGFLKSVEDVNGNLVTATADASGRITRLTHAEGQWLQISYSGDKIVKVENSLGYATTYAYTGDQLTKATYADGESVSYAYSGTSGLLKNTIRSVTYADGSQTVYEYDGSTGRLVGGYSQASDNSTKTDALRFTSGKTSADALVYTYTLAGTKFQTLWYNEKGQVLKSEETAANGQKTTTTYVYDTQGRLTGYSDDTGHSATMLYDADGNIAKVVNTLGQDLEFRYDSVFGSVTEIKDALGHVTSFEYDAKGNPVATVRQDGTANRLAFDSHGRVVESANRRGHVTKYEYNTDGTLKKIVIPDSGTPIEYAYDQYQNIRSISDENGTTTFTYSSDGLYLMRIDYPDGRYIKYEYDRTLGAKTSIDAGRKSGGSDVSEYHVEYVYNSFGLLDTVKNRVDGDLVTTNRYEYHATSGLLHREHHGNGTMTEYVYVDTVAVPEAFGVLQSKIEYRDTSKSSILSKSVYTYDVNGAVSSHETLDGKWTYRYDDIGQLVGANFVSSNTAVIANRTVSYEYDAAGNRVSVTTNGVKSNYVTDTMNRCLDDGEYTYKYDADGNMTEKRSKSGGGTWTYTWNAAGQLLKQTGPDGTFEYRYDSFGNRTGMKANGGAWTNYLVDPSGLGNVLFEYGSGGATVSYVYGYGLVSQTDTAGNDYYYGFDAQGSTTILTDANRSVVNRYAYDSFGTTLRSDETVANSYEYVGQFGVQNNDTGLLFMRARYYDAQTGRFISEDPIGLDAGDMNLYRYCTNDPINTIDPSGEWAHIVIGGLIGGLVNVTVHWATTDNASITQGSLWRSFAVGATTGAATAIVLPYAALLGTGVMTGFGLTMAATGEMWSQILAGGSFEGGWHIEGKSWGKVLQSGFTKLIAKGPTNKIKGLLEKVAWLSDDQIDLLGKFTEKFLREGMKNIVDYLSVLSRLPHDPNRIVGPSGYGEAGYISVDADTVLPYRIEFQNSARALGSAHDVLFTMQLDPNLDPNSFSLTGFGFGRYRFDLTADDLGKEIVQAVTAPDSRKTVEVVFTATLVGSKLDIVFRTRNIGSDGLVDVLDGFLGIGGSGYVTYDIKVKPGSIRNGTEIRAVGFVQFDKGDVFATDLINRNDPKSGHDPNRQCLLTISNERLGMPVNLQASATSATSVRLSWESGDAQNRAAAYRIERWDPVESVYVLVGQTKNLHYTVTGLQPDTEYLFRITAVNTVMDIRSETVLFQTVKTPQATQTAPVEPTGFKTTAQSATSIALAWNAGSSVNSYLLQCSTSGSDWNDITTLSGSTNLYTHNGLAAGTDYQYRLFAINGGGTSPAATLSTSTTTLVPAAPTGLSVSAVDSSTLYVYWNESPYAASYRLEYSLNGTTWNPVSPSPLTGNEFRHTELAENTTYYYRVTATNAAGSSAASASESAKTLPVGYNVHDWQKVASQNLEDYVTWTKIDGEYRLTEIDVPGSSLIELDLSGCTALKILECAGDFTLADGTLTKLNVSGCTALEKLNAEDNQLVDLNLTGCSALMELYTYGSRLAELNVSDCTALKILYTPFNQLTELDVSANTALEVLWCEGNQLTELDISTNTALKELWCEDNQLTELNVSANTALTVLACHSNQLTELDVSKNTALEMFWCYSNRLTFSTLPTGTGLTDNRYADQQPMAIECVDGKVDLSSEYSIDGAVTNYVWYYENGTVVDSGLVTGGGGVFTFAPALLGQTVYCEMTNTAFPELTLETTKVTIVTASVMPPAAPTNFTVTKDGMNMNLAWNAVDGADTYHVWRWQNGDWKTVAKDIVGTSCVDTQPGLGTGLYAIKARNATGYGEMKTVFTDEKPDKKPEIPPNFTATASGDVVNLSWSAAEGADTYQIWRWDIAKDDWITVAKNIAGTSYVDTSPELGTGAYIIKARNETGYSDLAMDTTYPTPPKVPTGFVATVAGSTVNLSWNPASGADTYHVWRWDIDKSTWVTVARNIIGTSCVDESPELGTGTYIVKARNEEGYSDLAITSTSTEKPKAPTNFVATRVGGVVNLSWSPAAGADSYHVWRWNGTNWKTVEKVIVGTFSIDKSPELGTGLYMIKAHNGNGYSDFIDASIVADGLAAAVLTADYLNDFDAELECELVFGTDDYNS